MVGTKSQRHIPNCPPNFRLTGKNTWPLQISKHDKNLKIDKLSIEQSMVAQNL